LQPDFLPHKNICELVRNMQTKKSVHIPTCKKVSVLLETNIAVKCHYKVPTP
jgi:hypothetical protein